jgi:hypothetical protein
VRFELTSRRKETAFGDILTLAESPSPSGKVASGGPMVEIPNYMQLLRKQVWEEKVHLPEAKAMRTHLSLVQ